MENHRLGYYTPYKSHIGETGDLFHLHYPFWSPIWYCPLGFKGLGIMHKGRYLGPATRVGNKITHYIIPVVSTKLDKESIMKVSEIKR